MAEKRKRSQNFTQEEKAKLVKLIGQCRDKILNKKTDGASNEAKARAWEYVTLKFNSSSNYPRTKDSLMKLWEKFKTEARLNKRGSTLHTTGTGSGPDESNNCPVIDSVSDLVSSRCTGIQGVNDFGAVHNKEHNGPINITFESVTAEAYDSDYKAGGGEDSNSSDHMQPESCKNAPDICNSPPRARRRRPPSRLTSYAQVNSKKMDAEDLKVQLLQEELTFKRELHQRQLEEMNLKIEAAFYEKEMKQEALSQIKGGSLSLRKLFE